MLINGCLFRLAHLHLLVFFKGEYLVGFGSFLFLLEVGGVGRVDTAIVIIGSILLQLLLLYIC